ncbi:MAG TPA: NAD(+) synthase [Bacillales bacterium]|nr:NAD(+) synthase [Bacillales bacterium]HEU5139713.1 NAD(+) synthase [Bacillales bacterium]
MEKSIEQLIGWMQNYVKESGTNGAVVGVSGGIDSAVVAHLIKRAFPDNSLGVIMPCKSNPDDQKDALAVVESAGIDYITVDLTTTHETLFSGVEKALNGKGDWNEKAAQLGDANLRARLRMSTLYAVQNNYGYLVAGTDNAAEWYTGYFTKYGDGGVDIVPLVHFTKGQVYEMAKLLGVPDQILHKKPSAGLWEGQTDENEMGTTYEKIDAYLQGQEIPEKDRNIIENLHSKTAHKRRLAAAPPEFKTK